MAALRTVHDDIDHWFFARYFQDFIAIGTGKLDPDAILSYWGSPLHVSNPVLSTWITSPEGVVGFLKDMQSRLAESGYTHTKLLDKQLTVYNQNAGRVETIMSRCRKDDSEIDRAAISFEVRRKDASWIIISTAAQPTDKSGLRDLW